MLQSPSQLGHVLLHTAAQLAKQSDQVLQEQLGIGLSQLRILRTLQSAPDTSQLAIAKQLGQTEPSISRQVKLLTAHGLLQSRISRGDHRQHQTILTHRGLRLTMAAYDVLDRYYQPKFLSLNKRQLEQLSSELERLHQGFCRDDHNLLQSGE